MLKSLNMAAPRQHRQTYFFNATLQKTKVPELVITGLTDHNNPSVSRCLVVVPKLFAPKFFRFAEDTPMTF
jgi:hypothetical protein